MKTLAALFALVAALIFAPSLASPAQAQPAQWNYSLPGNISTAVYPGNVNILGTCTGCSSAIPATAYASLSAMLAASPQANLLGWVPGSQGGNFVLVNQACNFSGAGDGGIQFPSTTSGWCWIRQINPGTLAYNGAWYGMLCGAPLPTGNVSGTAGSATITDSGNPWGNVQPGWKASIFYAGASTQELNTTVSTVNSAGSLTLATTLANNISSPNGIAYIYPDDTAGFTKVLAAANAAGVPVQLPAGQNCGFVNPGIFNVFTFTGSPGLDLNHGQLWLGQTGAVYQTGWVLAFSSSNQGVWDGIINGLYQTNQGIQQGYSGAIVFNPGGVYGLSNDFLHDITITNTKSRSLSATNINGLNLTNVKASYCGDLGYVANYAYMAQCLQIENPYGANLFTNIEGDHCGQACLIYDNLSGGTPDPYMSLSINGFSSQYALYYGLDIEGITTGCIKLNNISINNNALTPSGNVIAGGGIFRNANCLVASNVKADTPGNNFVVEDSGGNGNPFLTVQLSNINTLSSDSSHNGLLYMVTGGGLGVGTKWSVNGAVTDTFQFGTNTAVACSTTQPMGLLFNFNDLRVSHEYTGSYDTIYSQQGNASTMFYVQGRSSDLGRTDYTSAGSNPLATDLDYLGVWEGTPTYSGSITRIGRASTSWTNPMTFACPT